MATASYTYSYGIQTYVPNGEVVVTGSAQVVDATLTEIDDPVDGDTSAGADIQYTTTGGVDVTVTYVAITAAGDPIILSSSGSYFVLSNADDLKGTPANTSETSFPYCFAAGTRIATPVGEVTIETLTIGDLVMTEDGRSVPVQWIGRQTVTALFSGDRARPVRVSAGALGGGLPHTDLVLTADHALILDGLAITAGVLVNGTTITLDPAPDRATYYHIETEAHDVILANGAPAETYVDYAARRAFDNYAEYADLYGDQRAIAEMATPRISSARLLPPALRAKLAA